MVELHSRLSLDMTYTSSFAVADLLWIFICGIDLRLKSHQDIHDHLNPAPTDNIDTVPEPDISHCLHCVTQDTFPVSSQLPLFFSSEALSRLHLQ